MTGSTTQEPRPTPTQGRPRRWLPFWVLQATEVAVAVVFADVSIHVANGGVLVAGALAFFALAATAHGPLGIVRICSQSLHLVIAMVVAALVAVAPLFPLLRPDIEGIIVMEFGAVGILRMATLTRAVPTSAGASSPRWSRSNPAVIDTTATVLDPSTRRAPGPPPSTPTSAGPSTPGAAARWAGRATGAAAASGKRAAARYGPTAEARVKRTIRSAGRIAGSVTSTPADPTEHRD